MSPLDEQELRSLLQRVEPVETDELAQRVVAAATRRRRRRRTAAGATAAVMLVAGVVTGRAIQQQVPSPEPATLATPSHATPSPLGPVSTAQLPTAAELAPLATPRLPLGTAVDHPSGQWGADQVSLCRARPELDTSSLQVREYPGAELLVAAVGFDNPAQATAARDQIVRWYSMCAGTSPTPRPGAWLGERLPTPAGLPQPAGATVVEASQGPLPNGTVRHELGVVVQSGNRLTWLVQRVEGQEGFLCALRADDEVTGQCGQFAVVPDLARRLAR
ncbi:hypothetical protein [Luteococcus peritonei]|uniref:Sensor domain-containing protein n=1 Tax=Luteococcus peritonei TaxID=88874 RepID=A0ABW4RTN8_9ACTN